MHFKLNLLLLLFVWKGIAQESNFTSVDITLNTHIDGTLLNPESDSSDILAIIIASSGPTDRDGNQNFLKNNSLKKLAEGLAKNGISTFRYDKRIVKQIRNGNIDKNIMFDEFVTDAHTVIDYFKAKNSYSKIYIVGHGQGSLIGMISGKNKIDGLVSLAGPGQSIDKVILEQIGKMDQSLYEPTETAIKSLREGKTTTDYPPALIGIFNLDTQPFMMNWMQYDPIEVIKELQIPILIVNGTKDLQVPIEEAKQLSQANKNAKLEVIPNMNHVLFIIEGDDLENSKAYNESFRPISEALIKTVSAFIKS